MNLAEYHRRAKSTKPKVDPRSVSLSRALAGQSGDRKRKSEGGQNGDRQRKREGAYGGDRTATSKTNARRGVPATSRTNARRGVRAGVPATSRTSARRGVKVGKRAGYLELLLRADATATTTMHSSHRRPVSRAMHLSVTVSIERKV